MQNIYSLPDTMYHFTLADGMVRGLAIKGTQLVAEAAAIHNTSAVATAALGRTLMGTTFLGAMLKSEKASVTVTVDGGGPIGKIVCVADAHSVRGCVDNPYVDAPLRADGKLPVGTAVGHQGRISVVKDLGLKAPYMGQTPLVTGEIAEDFAHYFVISEQQPTLLSLGVLVNGEVVLSAGGLLLQPLPGCPDSIIDALELRSPLFGDISHELCHDPLRVLLERWFDGLDPVILSEEPVAYRCDCSRERMEKALIALGKEELTHMIEDETNGADLHCHFCKRCENFSQQDLAQLLHQALNHKE